jgi:dual specificity phosphatase 12
VRDPSQTEHLPAAGITHLITLSPVERPPPFFPDNLKRQHLKVANTFEYNVDLLLALPNLCDFIDEAIESGGSVLIHGMRESRICIVASGYRKNQVY